MEWGKGGSGKSGAGNCQCNQSLLGLLSMPSSRCWSHRGVWVCSFHFGWKRQERREGGGSRESGRILDQCEENQLRNTYTNAKTKHHLRLKQELVLCVKVKGALGKWSNYFSKEVSFVGQLTLTITNRRVLVVLGMIDCAFSWKQPANSLWTEEVSNMLPIPSLIVVRICRPLVCTW